METKPDIYIIMSDQHAAAALGAWGNREVRTPNLDRLAGDSFNFTNTYCPAPICGPSRFSFLTGRHVHRCGAFDNGSSIPYDSPTLGHLMTNAGYRSVLCGRMHLHGPDQMAGFEERPEVGLINPIHSPASAMKPRGSFRDEPFPVARGTDYDHYEVSASPILNYDDYVVDRACEFSTESRPDDPRALFMVVGLCGPHPSMRAREKYQDWIKMYDEMDLSVNEFTAEQMAAAHPYTRESVYFCGSVLPDREYNRRKLVEYYARISYTDELIGRFLGTLKDTGKYDNSWIIYCSDHGENMGFKGRWGKVTFSENSTRIPLMVKPPHKTSRTDRSHITSLVDIFPTLAELTGMDAGYEINGNSLLPVLKESFTEKPDDIKGAALSQFHGVYTSHSNFMLRKGDYKYCRYNGLEPELYNIADDPCESRNLAQVSEFAQKTAEMDAELVEVLGMDPERIESEIRDNQTRRNFISRAVAESPIVRERLQRKIQEYRDFHNSPWWDGGKFIGQFETQFKK